MSLTRFLTVEISVGIKQFFPKYFDEGSRSSYTDIQSGSQLTILVAEITYLAILLYLRCQLAEHVSSKCQ